MNEKISRGKKDPSETQPLVAVPYEYLPLCNSEEDTIDLRELWSVLQRRKGLILTVTATILSLALMYAFLARRAYEAKATLEIGHTLVQKGGGGLAVEYFDDAKVLKHYIDTKYDTVGNYRIKAKKSFISSVVIPRKTRGFLTLTAMGPDNASAKEEMNGPIEDILAKHKAYYNSIVTKKQQAVKTINQQIDYNIQVALPQMRNSLKLLQTMQLQKIDNEIKFFQNEKIPVIDKKIIESKKEIVKRENSVQNMQQNLQEVARRDAAMATMTAMQIATMQNDIAKLRLNIFDLKSDTKKIQEESIPDLETEKQHLLNEVIPAKEAEIKKIQDIIIPEFRTQIKQLELSLQAPYLVMTHVIGRVFIHDYPVKPRKKLIVAVAGLAGLLLGIFIAFSMEFMGKKEE